MSGRWRPRRSLPLHPTLLELQAAQGGAQLRRMLRGFRSPRRLALSVLALALAVVWIGQTLASVLLRPPADPQRLRDWIALGMLAYAAWHLIKAAFRRPREPMEWTAAEVELLCGSPFTRRQLLFYRLSTISSAALLKSALFCLVMLPDIPLLATAFAALLLGLLLIDLTRLVFELLAWGCSRRQRRWLQIAVGTAAAGAAASIATIACAAAGGRTSWLELLPRLLQSAVELQNAAPLRWLSAPWQLVADVVLTDALAWRLAGQLATLALWMTGAVWLVDWLDGWASRLRIERERVEHQRKAQPSTVETLGLGVDVEARPPASAADAGNCRSSGHERSMASKCLNPNGSPAPRETSRSSAVRQGPDTQGRAPTNSPAAAVCTKPATTDRVHWCRGAISIAWTQWLGARHYGASLAWALLVPGVLSLLPLAAPVANVALELQLIGGLAFYSFILLPTALKFDYRRSVDRLLIFKALPLPPMAVTAGQLAAPVIVTVLFQAAVCLVATLLAPVSPPLLAAGLLLLLPANVLVLATENLIFLLYPYRLNQEGIAIFLRTVLMFTAKALLLTGGLALFAVWSVVCRGLAARWMAGPASGQAMFITGLWLLLAALAALAIGLLSRTFRRFDISCDLPSSA